MADADFLAAHAGCWTAQQAAEFSVVNVHAMEIPAPAERIFPELAGRDLLAPGPFWKLLIGVRGAVGRVFGWDPGMSDAKPQALELGKYFAFFHVINIDAPREVGMTFENKLTRAVLSWLLVEELGGRRLYNVTCANFKGRRGRIYWRVIRPFHDRLIEASLRRLRRRVQTH